MGNVGCVRCCLHVPCRPLVSLDPASEGPAWKGLGPGHCVPDREARRVGMGQSQDKGLVVPSEKTQTWFP